MTETLESLTDKVAVITGAASGIGKAVATACLQAGMKVVLADVEQAALEVTTAQLRAAGGTVLPIVTNVADPDAVEALAQVTMNTFGAVHLLCNNAGVAVDGPLWEMSLRDWEWVLGVNLWGVIHGIRAFVPRMLAQGDAGHIVNTASIAGLVSTPGLGVYNVSKHGVVTLSETLYQELQQAHANIHVSVLCPAWVKTRIGASARNRPPALHDEPTVPNAARQAGDQAMQPLIDNGVEPEYIAEQVLAAVRERRFYILTHPPFTKLVEERMMGILHHQPPKAPGLG
ncbi:MAG: SDR family NAD(P)-dependent oxidoreductase [Caldilineaceae bacterium]